jgi:RimJ/RimL family protein N-acetyltransferase
MTLKTERTVLRQWREADAEKLYEFAKNPNVGPIAGWPVHTSAEDSLRIIREVLSEDETYAVTLRDEDAAIGSIGLQIGQRSSLGIKPDEAELGYWLAEPYWGRGLIPEAAEELLRHAFKELKLHAVWCGYFDGNEKSKRVSEKCGFVYHRTEYGKPWPLLGTVVTQHITVMTAERLK